jgi:hypothetical protein
MPFRISWSGTPVQVYEWPEGALRGEPEVFGLPAEATDSALGALDGYYAGDIAVAAGADVLIVRGRDRRLSWDVSVREAVASAVVDRLRFDSQVQSLAVGRFHDRTYRQLAVLPMRLNLDVLADLVVLSNDAKNATWIFEMS